MASIVWLQRRPLMAACALIFVVPAQTARLLWFLARCMSWSPRFGEGWPQAWLVALADINHTCDAAQQPQTPQIVAHDGRHESQVARDSLGEPLPWPRIQFTEEARGSR